MDRAEIFRMYARHGPGGELSYCSDQRGTGSRGKVIFTSETKAREAAETLAAWTAALVLEPYRCPYAKHFHLTKAKPGHDA